MIRLFTSKTQQIGEKGEEIAVNFLKKNGFNIKERNVHSRNGEIDIVATKKKLFYFFEVKTGQQGSWFNPAENLTKDKLWKFYRSVEYYCLKHRVKDHKIQGIIVLLPELEKAAPNVEIIDLS